MVGRSGRRAQTGAQARFAEARNWRDIPFAHPNPEYQQAASVSVIAPELLKSGIPLQQIREIKGNAVKVWHHFPRIDQHVARFVQDKVLDRRGPRAIQDVVQGLAGIL